MFRDLEGSDGIGELMGQEVALLFKHSPICWMSAMAHTAVEHFARERPELPVYAIDVLADRQLARALAAELEVPHASPQVIVLRHGKPVWNASHLRITTDALEKAAA